MILGGRLGLLLGLELLVVLGIPLRINFSDFSLVEILISNPFLGDHFGHGDS